MAKYIYDNKNWTDFTWDDKVISALFGEVRLMQGKIIGQMNALGFSAKEETTLNLLTLDVMKSSAIEGEILNYDQVRSSIAKRLRINVAGILPSSHYVEEVVQMTLDATKPTIYHFMRSVFLDGTQHSFQRAIVLFIKLKLRNIEQKKCR